MAQTYGEIVEHSFQDVFAFVEEDTVFLDIGSGRGLITAASVQQSGCRKAVGVEKYRDKFQESQDLHASLPEDIRSKVQFILGDFNDFDLTEMVQVSSNSSLLLFCNNLAFNQGTNHRLGRHIRRAMDALPAVKFTVIATTPLRALLDRLHSSIPLDMTWGSQHVSSVYVWHGEKEASEPVLPAQTSDILVATVA